MVERILEETTSDDTDLVAYNGRRIDSSNNAAAVAAAMPLTYAGVLVNSNRNGEGENGNVATTVMMMNNNNNDSCTQQKTSGMFCLFILFRISFSVIFNNPFLYFLVFEVFLCLGGFLFKFENKAMKTIKQMFDFVNQLLLLYT